MSKQNAAKNKAQEPGETYQQAASNELGRRIDKQMFGSITAADLDAVLNLLPMSKIHLASMLRYGDDPWTPIEKARAKLEELKARFSG